jgi:hypothetical protein
MASALAHGRIKRGDRRLKRADSTFGRGSGFRRYVGALRREDA